MSEKNKDGEGKDAVIEFETLEEEEKKETPNKITELRAFLKDNLDAEKYGESMKILGIDETMTNEQLLEALLEGIQLLMKPKEEEEEEKKKPEEEEEEEKHAAPDRKTFLEECMKAGKTMTECDEEFKKKYPAPDEKKKEEAATEEEKKTELALPEEVRKEFDELKLEINRLKDERRLSSITHQVDEQIAEKHLAPVQKAGVIKLMAALPDEQHEDFLKTFEKVRFTGFEDVGHAKSKEPGAPEELSEEARSKILDEHGITDLILERGVRRPAN